MSAAKIAASFRSTRSTGTLSSSPSEYSDGRDRRASLKRRSLPPGRIGPDRPLSGGAARPAGDHEGRLRVDFSGSRVVPRPAGIGASSPLLPPSGEVLLTERTAGVQPLVVGTAPPAPFRPFPCSAALPRRHAGTLQQCRNSGPL